MEASGQLHAPIRFAPRSQSVWYLFIRGLRDVENEISFLPLSILNRVFLAVQPVFSCSPSTTVVSRMKPNSAGISLYCCHTKGRDKVDICNSKTCVSIFYVIHSVRCASAVVCTHRHVHTIKLSIIRKAGTVLHVSAVHRHLEGNVNTKQYFTF
jgi:hypothetical protein